MKPAEGPIAGNLAVPSDEEWAEREASRHSAMTPAERLRSLAALNAAMDRILGGRLPEREDGERPFWMHWRDPALGRPR